MLVKCNTCGNATAVTETVVLAKINAAPDGHYLMTFFCEACEKPEPLPAVSEGKLDLWG